MPILRISLCDYGGLEAWDSRQPDQPVYIAPHLLSLYWSDGLLNIDGIAYVESVVTERISLVTIETAKADKLAELDAWYAATSESGVTVGALILPASIEDQNRYTALVTMEHLAVSLGQRQLTDTSGLANIDGEWQTMTVAELFGTLLQYATVVSEWSVHYADVIAQIHGAETIEEVEAIEV